MIIFFIFILSDKFLTSVEIAFSFVQIINLTVKEPVAEFSVPVCSTRKFICSSDDGVPRFLTRRNDTSYKSNIYKNRMI